LLKLELNALIDKTAESLQAEILISINEYLQGIGREIPKHRLFAQP
jgi:hypothetical protein